MTAPTTFLCVPSPVVLKMVSLGLCKVRELNGSINSASASSSSSSSSEPSPTVVVQFPSSAQLGLIVVGKSGPKRTDNESSDSDDDDDGDSDYSDDDDDGGVLESLSRLRLPVLSQPFIQLITATLGALPQATTFDESGGGSKPNSKSGSRRNTLENSDNNVDTSAAFLTPKMGRGQLTGGNNNSSSSCSNSSPRGSDTSNRKGSLQNIIEGVVNKLRGLTPDSGSSSSNNNKS